MKKFFNYVKSLFTEDDKFIALMIGFITGTTLIGIVDICVHSFYFK